MTLVELLPVGPGTAQWPLWTTTARVVVTDPGDLPLVRSAVEDLCAAVDLAASRFRPDAEIHRVYRAAGRPITVSPLLADLVAASLVAARQSEGLVDPTVAGAMRALGYEQADVLDQDVSVLPVCGSSVRVTTRRVAGWQAVELNECRLRVPAGVSLDLGASAKAWTADRAVADVSDRVHGGVLVALGGDIATFGPGPGPDGSWPVLVSDGPDEPSEQVTLPPGAAIATSSTISRTWRRGGQMVHHILDPRTSRPAPTTWRTVTVAAPTCLRANTLTTAAIVRGPDAPAWLRRQRATARLVTAHRDVVRVGAWPQDVAA